jgi:hypothetical protein
LQGSYDFVIAIGLGEKHTSLWDVALRHMKDTALELLNMEGVMTRAELLEAACSRLTEAALLLVVAGERQTTISSLEA